MPNRKKGVNTGKKYNLLRDELGVTGSGVYGLTPSENKDRQRRMPIKVGHSKNLEERVAQYSGYYPQGVYVVALLSSIPVPKRRRSQTPQTEHNFLNEVENFIRDYAAARDNSKRLRSTDRTHKLVDKKGVTEWVFSRVENIHEAFMEAHLKYGGKLTIEYLQGVNMNGKYEDVQKPGKNTTFITNIAF